MKYTDLFYENLQNTFRGMLSKYVIIKDGYRVLDVNCKEGKLLNMLASRKNIKGYGVDMGAVNILTARDSYKTLNFKLSDPCELEYKDDFFDMVTICLGMHDIKDVDSFLLEAYRVLKPGGYLYIAEPHESELSKLAMYVLSKTTDIESSTVYSAETLIKKMGVCGLKCSGLIQKGVVQIIAARKPSKCS